jgi:CubicO group peptidase (beta-lactamase class C family)
VRGLALLAGLFLSSLALAAPDEALLGKAEGYPTCLGAPRCMVGRWSGMDTLFPAHKVAKGAAARELKRAGKAPDFGVDAFLDNDRNTGLLVLQGDTILVERYQYERKPEHRFESASMAKTVLGMLVGFALQEKSIKSIEDKAEQYVPELKGHPYGEVTIRNLLTMSSGMQFHEAAEGRDAEAVQMARLSVGGQSVGGAATVLPFTKRERPQGQAFNYSSGDSQVLGLALRAAVGKPLADYLSEKIWQPMGAEADAHWLVDKGGNEAGFCCIGATLRDWGRFGLLLANYGSLDGKQIIPAEWVKAATTPEAPHLRVGRATRNNGYGYQTWITSGREPRFAALGIYGQGVYVAPVQKVVIVHTAVHASMRDLDARGRQFLFQDNVLTRLSN